jgi:hypothetical protein
MKKSMKYENVNYAQAVKISLYTSNYYLVGKGNSFDPALIRLEIYTVYHTVYRLSI